MAAVDPRVRMWLGGDWVSIPDVRQNPPVQVVVGAKDEDTQASPNKCTLELDDPEGDYDPGNPMGQWFGELRENTRLDVAVPLLADDFADPVSNGWGVADDGTAWVNGAASGGTVASSDWSVSGGSARHSVPAANALRTSDLAGRVFINCELRFQVTLPTTNITGAPIAVVAKLRTLDDSNYLYTRLIVNTDETVQLGILDKIAGVDRVLHRDTTIVGLSATVHTALSVAVLVEGQVVRAKVWHTAGVEPLDWHLRATRATVREGYVGVVSVVGSGNTNTKPLVFAYPELSVGIPVFHGEISEFTPGVADESHAAPTMAITASGIGRRVEQGSEPLKSAMFRGWSSPRGWIRAGAAVATSAPGETNILRATSGDAADVPVGSLCYLINGLNQYKEDQLFTVTSVASGVISFTPDALDPIAVGDQLQSFRLATTGDLPVVYWPCEDDRDATSIASGLVGGTPLEIRVASPEGAVFDSFAGSAPILKLNNAELVFDVPDYPDPNEAFTVHMLLHFPAVDEAATGQAILQFTTTGSAETWAIQYAAGGSDGDLVVSAWNTAGTLLFSTPYALGMRGTPRMVTFSLDQTGPSTVEYTLTTVRFSTDGGFGIAGPAVATATGVSTLGKVTSGQINPGGGYVDVGFGHLALVPAKLDYFNLVDRVTGWHAENAPRRMIRLAYEENEPLVYCQGPMASGTLGPQLRDTLLENLAAVVEREIGRFFESKGAYSFEFRPRNTLYNQPYTLDLDYEAGAVLTDLVPARDDQASRNDITVKRIGGSSARAVKQTGAKSVEAIGRYTDAPEISAASDTPLANQAAWRLHLGTVAEDRYPTIRITSANNAVSLERMLSIGVGDRIRLTNTAARRRFEPIDQLVPGYTLTLHRYKPVLEMNCIPASPYNVAILDHPQLRLDADTSVLQNNITASATTFVVTTIRSTWTTDPTHFPFDILVGGERCTVTTIIGTGFTVQDFVVTRAVNGVSRAWAGGTTVSLADPHYLPL